MRPTTTVPFRPHYQPSERTSSGQGSLASLVTTILLAVILIAGPSVLGAARLWYELPLLGVIAVLLMIQAVRLLAIPGAGAFRHVDAIDLSVVLFVVYALIRWQTSPTEYFSRVEVLNVIGYAILFFTCRYGLVRREYGLALVIVLAVLGAAETGFGYYLSLHSDVNHPESLWFPFGPTERLQLHYAPRWVGTYGCPDHYAALLVMALGAMLAIGCFSKLGWPVRIVCCYLAAVILVAIFYSYSRGGWLALVGCFGALTFFALRYGTLRWWVLVIGLVLLSGAVTTIYKDSPTVQSRVAEIADAVHDGTVQNYFRVQLARDALHIAHDYPAFGTGPATFIFVHPRYQGPLMAYRAELTHDDYLNCLCDYGLVGFAIAMFFVWAVTLALFQRVRADFRWGDRVVVATALAAWCALLIHSLFDFNLHIPANAMVLFALAGLGLRRLPREEIPRHWSTLPLAPLGRWLGWGLLVFALLDAAELGRTAVSDILYEHTFATAETASSVESIQALDEALTIDPGNAQAMVLLGDLYRVRALKEKEIGERVSEGQRALEAYAKAWKANPLDDTIQARRGLTFDAMRRYSEAFFCYQVAVTAQPYDGQFWSALGNHFWQRGLLQKAEQAYLIASQCPHGSEGAAASAHEVRAILDQQGFPPSVPGTNPLTPQSETEEPQTIP